MNKQVLNKNQYNASGEKHGYWEFYYSDGKLWISGYYNNGEPDGYWEFRYNSGDLMRKFYLL
jgi:antitoxin component YwqK of YwqJK toxin-antitoxin module